MKNCRNGTTSILVLVCMAVVSVILLSAVSFSLRHRSQLRLEVQMEQTYWLLDAGVGKAMSELKNDPQFEGLTVSVNDSFEKYNGELKIEIDERLQDQSQVTVTAKIQGKHKRSPVTQRSLTVLIDSAIDKDNDRGNKVERKENDGKES